MECDEHDEAWADRENGELTFSPLDGLLIETLDELDEVFAVAAWSVAFVTVMATSVTHTAP